MPSITVAVADHKKAGRAACLRVLQPEKGIQVVLEARSGLEAIVAVAKLRPRILLFHLNLLKRGEINFLRVVHHRSPGTKVILLTHRVSGTRILEALSHGVRGYLKESAISTFLVEAVRKVEAGEAWLPRNMVSKVVDCLARLSPREGEDSDIRLKYIESKSN